ncbi:interferon-induced protein 44-like [Oryzias melastigma]|uniref:Interferon-induced protein 44-like n=1 Tax=Oryzias melastigma TaxID=30732 RepID=A0A3B3BDK4_ORYME|nr:interferon-induced protein 44-like [Oryzias melastigma]
MSAFSTLSDQMNSSLTNEQQKEICSQLGNVKLKLLYKATTHGFGGKAFHQICDNKSPTVSVGYNKFGYVFGGYTSQPFSQSGDWVEDDQAFLFCFSKEKLNKYPVNNPPYAMKMTKNSGPNFGDTLIFVYENKPEMYSNPRNSKITFFPRYYKFPAEEMYGNDLKLTECEVYQVEEILKTEHPWRTTVWTSERRNELMEIIKSYKPLNTSVPQARVLLVGPVGSGKSSFFNSINSVFRGHFTSQAISGKCPTSLTTLFRSRFLKAGREGEPLPILICDTMGLEDLQGSGCHLDDIISIVKGHIPDRYQLSPSGPLKPEAHGFRKNPELKDKMHCVTYVLDASKISIMPQNMERKLKAVREMLNKQDITQLVLLTKVDEACPLVKKDIRNVYKSKYIKDLMQDAADHIGVPLSCVLPVKNYSEEVELDTNIDILVLTAVVQMLRFVDNYIDEISDPMSSAAIKD